MCSAGIITLVDQCKLVLPIVSMLGVFIAQQFLQIISKTLWRYVTNGKAMLFSVFSTADTI